MKALNKLIESISLQRIFQEFAKNPNICQKEEYLLAQLIKKPASGQTRGKTKK